MVRSRTWIRNEEGRFRQRLFAAALCFLASISGLPSATGQSTTLEPFLVSRSVPYSLPAQNDSRTQSLSAAEVGRLASSRCGAANRISSDSHSRNFHTPPICKEGASEKQLISSFQAAIAYRLRQSATANALKLHFGIAACLRAQTIFDQTLALLERQEKAQNQIADKGIPIPDPTLINRLRINLEDKRLENQSKIAVLRSQLSGLIGTENACGHAPNETQEIIPSDCNVCDHIEQASNCRCDLVCLKRLKSTITSETLDAWDSIGATLSGVPALAKQKPFWSKVLRPHRSKSEMESAIAARKHWLDEIVADRQKQIAMEIEVAFEKKRTAALRWVNAGQQVANWDNRIAQLESLSEVQGNLAAQFESQLNRSQSEGEKIERWAEWHVANVDLMLAIGCEF